MSAQNMAKRTAAGTLALAVCLGGGALAFAGAANAAPISAGVTAGADADTALLPSTNAQSIGSFTVNIPAGAQAGDTVTLTLAGPTGTTFAGPLTTSGNTSATAVLSGAGNTTLTLTVGTNSTPAIPLVVSGLKASTGSALGNVSYTGAGVSTAAVIASVTSDSVSSTGTATVAAKQAIKSTAQAGDDVTIALGTSAWGVGDRYVVQLPANVTWNGTPTVTAVKVSGTGTVAPTFSVAQLATISDDPTTSVSSDGVAAVRQMAITFTNAQGTAAADQATSYKLVVSGIKFDVASAFSGSSVVLGGSLSSVSASTDAKGKVYSETYASNTGNYSGAALATHQGYSDVLAYLKSGDISVASGFSYVNSGGVQAAPDVTITEALAGAFVSGTAELGFKDANGNILQLDGAGTVQIGADAFTPTMSVNGTALTTGPFVFNNSGDTLTTPTITPTTSVDKVVIGNLRFKSQNGVSGPVKAYLTGSLAAASVDSAPGVTVTGYQPVSNDIAINDPNVRLGGASRYDTAAQIAASRWTATNLNTFVLAAGDGSGVDALSANYVAGNGSQADKPVIITDGDWLPDATLAFLKSHTTTTTGAITFTVMGGKAAISDSVIAQLKEAFPSPTYTLVFNRYAGDDRYETAARAAINTGQSSAGVASFSNTYGKAAVRTAILASGENSADAVVAGGISYAGGFPMLLTKKGELPSSTINAINTLEIKQVIIVGGPNAVSTAVEDKLKGMGVTVIRKYGDTRYGTALQVAEFARTPVVSVDTKTDAGLGWNGASYNSTGTTWAQSTVPLLGNGSSYADILAAGQISGVSGSAYRPVLTTPADSLDASTKKWLSDHKASISNVTGLGGATVLSWDTLTAAVNAQK